MSNTTHRWGGFKNIVPNGSRVCVGRILTKNFNRMTRQEAIHLIEWLQKTPTAKQFYGIIPEELLRYYEEQNPALRIHDVVGRSEQLPCEHDYQPDITCGVDITCCTKCGDVI